MPPPFSLNHQSSHSSFPCFDDGGACAAEPPVPERLLLLPKAEVPIELLSRLRWSATLEKSSQNARLLSSMGTDL